MYHPALNRIIYIVVKFYVLICDWPDESSALKILLRCNFSDFGCVGDLYNYIDYVVLCDKFYNNLSQNNIKMCNDFCVFNFLEINYIIELKLYPEGLYKYEEPVFLGIKKLTFKGMRKVVSLMFKKIKMGQWMNQSARYCFKNRSH